MRFRIEVEISNVSNEIEQLEKLRKNEGIIPF